MANNKESVIAGNRRRRIYRRERGGTYYVRFEVDGRDLKRSLETTLLDVAKRKAAQIVEAAVNGHVEQSRKLKVRSDYSPLRAVLDIYLAKFGMDRRHRVTALNCISALERILRAALGLSVDDVRTSVLNGELVQK